MLVSGRAVSSTAQMRQSGLNLESKATIVMPSYIIVTHKPVGKESTVVALVETQQDKFYKKDSTDRAYFLKNLSYELDQGGNKIVVAEGRKFILNDTQGKFISSVTPSEIREASLLLCFDSGDLLAGELTRDPGRWDDYTIYQLSYNLKSTKVDAQRLGDVLDLLKKKTKVEALKVTKSQVSELGIGLLLAANALAAKHCAPELTGKAGARDNVFSLDISAPRVGGACCS